MEATSMMKLLKSFCDYSHWNYAVFWKLNHHFPLTLTWEDGYCGCLKTNKAAETMWTEAASSSCESTRSSEENSVRLLMTEMSHLKYKLGEGVVGKTALTGDHCWILFEDILTGKFQTNLLNECPYDCLLQVASAIKTIVLVPVLPLGVLQFGSLKKVTEDLEFVANVKEKFYFYHSVMANTSLLNVGENIQDGAFSAVTDYSLDNPYVSSITNSAQAQEYVGCHSLLLNELRLNLNDPPSVPVKGSTSRKIETNIPSTRVSNENEQVKVKSNQMEGTIETCSSWLNNVQVFGETSEGLFSYSRDVMAEQFGGTGTHLEDCDMVNSLCRIPLDSELHKALGPVANGNTFESESENLSLKDTNSASSKLMSGEKSHGHIMDSHIHKSEYLLDAVVGNLCSASDDSSSMFQTVMTASIHPQNHSEGSSLIVNNADSNSHLSSAFGANIDYDCTDLLSLASLDDNSSILFDGAQRYSNFVHKQSKSEPKLSSIGKKRARVGNTSRPRPRDRQLIMERMKELRELVPDGTKCSIDILLDRTIKHMLYLREITNQAEKLKKIENKEVPEFMKKINGNHTGRSCAIDFGSELQVCPILIEDLECPGHMLIEVMCSEHGLFLEIAQVIRQLDLTILKGVLESSSTTAWARFIVEVPRGFHRMDVLCPLLHLLQTGTSPVSSRI